MPEIFLVSMFLETNLGYDFVELALLVDIVQSNIIKKACDRFVEVFITSKLSIFFFTYFAFFVNINMRYLHVFCSPNVLAHL